MPKTITRMCSETQALKYAQAIPKQPACDSFGLVLLLRRLVTVGAREEGRNHVQVVVDIWRITAVEAVRGAYNGASGTRTLVQHIVLLQLLPNLSHFNIIFEIFSAQCGNWVKAATI